MTAEGQGFPFPHQDRIQGGLMLLGRRHVIGGLVGSAALSIAPRATASPMGLIIHHGSPHWWLSPDIWLANAPSTSGSPHVANPAAGSTYDVWVRVTNPTKATLSTALLKWNLEVVWAYPFAGSIPLSSLPAGDVLNSTGLDAIPGGTSVDIKCTNTWTPKTGHECIVAWTNASNIAYPSSPYLEGDAGPANNWSIAQHNFIVLPVKMRKFHLAFQVCNGVAKELSFDIAARQAPLETIEALLPGVPGGLTLLNRQGKVEHLGLVASKDASADELDQAPAQLTVTIGPQSCQAFTLGGVLPGGNALINITQTRQERVVGGLSVLAMADEQG